MGCAVGRASGQLLRLTCCACPHAPRERPFFPARVHWSCCDSPGTRDPRGLSSKPCAGAVVQGFVTEPPWTLRFLSPEAMPSEFASPRNQHAGLQRLSCWATLQSQLASSPGSQSLQIWSRRPDGHAGRRPFIPKLRSTSKPPSERAWRSSPGLRGCRITFPSFSASP